MMKKILLVDDNVDMLFLLKKVMTKAGYEVSTLAQGKEVLPVAILFKPDLIILDINLGDADGRELCQQIKCLEDFNHIPIILYSGEEFPDFNIADCQADIFIRKPFSENYFMEVVARVLAWNIPSDANHVVTPALIS